MALSVRFRYSAWDDLDQNVVVIAGEQKGVVRVCPVVTAPVVVSNMVGAPSGPGAIDGSSSM
jgi:hypothetical protein